MKKRTNLLAIRLTVVIVLTTLLGSTLAVLTRKEQSLLEMLGHRTKIKENYAAMRENTRLLHGQIGSFRQQLSIDQQRSYEMQLYIRLDQIKTELKPLEMNITAIESKDGMHSIGFTLKLPLTAYTNSINTMGRLQAGLYPLTTFKAMNLTATPGTDFTVDGSVFIPLQTGVKP